MLFTDEMKKLHVGFLKKHLGKLPSKTSSYDTNRISILFFALSGLDLFNEIDSLGDETKKSLIDWIYLQQLHPQDDHDLKEGKFGFPTTGGLKDSDCCNVTITYCALASLIILGDDLSRLHRKEIIQSLKYYQKEEGNFIQALAEGEDDLRIVYSMATICYILNDWSSIDVDKMAQYIKSCLTYEHGFGQKPGAEAHGGITYCALASLYLMGKLDQVLVEDDMKNIVHWCLNRQVNGFQGRASKEPDSCYSFWVGASLYLLDSFKLVNDKHDRYFLGSTQDCEGGFGKHPDVIPDILHTFLSISALSLRKSSLIDTESTDVLPVFPALNISERALAHLRSLQKNWSY